MPKQVITPAKARYIKRHYKTMTASHIAAYLGVSKCSIYRCMEINGWVLTKTEKQQLRIEAVSKTMSGRTSSTPRLDKFLKQHYLSTPVKTMSRMIGRSPEFVKTRLRQLGLNIPQHVIEQNKKSSYIKKGHIPHNKGKKMTPEMREKVKHTFFNKDRMPHNTKERDGIITIRKDVKGTPYKYIRVSLGIWKQYHRHRWEMFRGPIPKGMVLRFIDGDTMNTKLSNLELITRAENAVRNCAIRYKLPLEIIQTNSLIRKLRKSITHHEKQTS